MEKKTGKKISEKIVIFPLYLDVTLQEILRVSPSYRRLNIITNRYSLLTCQLDQISWKCLYLTEIHCPRIQQSNYSVAVRLTAGPKFFFLKYSYKYFLYRSCDTS